MQAFANLNNFYDKIYVLSVTAAAERRKQFQQLFDGLNYQFYFGADKNTFSIEEVKQKNIYSEPLTKKNHRYSKTMKHGEIACAWSHKMIYEDMLQNGYQRILIFEDDAVPDEHVLQNSNNILKEIPPTAELVFWGWGKNDKAPPFSFLKKATYHLQHSLGFLKWNHQVITNNYARPYAKHLKKAGFHDFTYAYAINQTAAKKLIAMQTPLQYVADNLLAYAATQQQVEAYIVHPMAFLHDTLPDGSPKDSYIR